MSDFKTVYPGVYSPREEEILSATREKLEAQIGKPTMFPVTPADPTLMKLYANAWDPWNPLFNDEEYAKKTKYGSLIAIPCWKEPGAMFPMLPMDFGDKLQRANDGGAFEMYAPILPGDTFTTVCDDMIIEDLTPAEGSLGRYMRLEGRGSLYNQRGELVMTGITRGHNVFSFYKDDYTGERGPLLGGGPGGPGGPGGKMPRMHHPEVHHYTEEDWEFIADMWDKEYIRGAEKLYWEDVNVGDHPTPICSGPWTEMDMIKGHGLQIMGQTPLRDVIKTKEGRARMQPFADDYGIYYFDTAAHYCHRNQAGGRAMFYNTTGRNMLIRLLTNYMGDDGWLRYIDWHFMSDDGTPDSFLQQVPEVAGRCVDHHGMCSDCIIGKGYVTKKYLGDKGEHLIDLICWGENWPDGGIAQVIAATVELPSKG